MRPPRSEPLVCLLLCAAIGLTYAPVIGFGFVSVDDPTFVIGNPMVNRGLHLEGVRLAFTRVHSSNWIPLSWLSHALDVSLFGLEASRHHLVNLLLHALNACLVFLVSRRLTAPADFWKCAVVAALFALHPTHVETVAWVSERKGLLSTSFWWLAIGAYARHVGRPSAGRLAIVALAMLLGLLAKGMLVTLPLALLLLDVWPLRRLTQATSASRLRRVAAEKLPLLALSLAAGAATVWAQASGRALQGLTSVSLDERVANAVLAYVRYLGILVWPVDLSPFYPRLDGEALAWFGPVGAAAALLLGISAAALVLARSRPYLFVGWLWYLVTLLPVIGLIRVGAHSIADRYTYVPSFGLYLAGVWGVADLWPARGRGPPLVVATTIGLLACAALSHAQLRHWSSGLAFWTQAVAVTPGAIAHAQLANELLEADRPDEALPHAQRAIEIDPRSARAHHTLGAVLLSQGHTAAAGTEFFRALEIDPDFAPSQLARGVILHEQGNYARAVDLFERVLAQRPQYAQRLDMIRRYAESLRRELASGQVGFEKAVQDHRRALALRPDWLEVRQSLAWILATHPKATPEHGREAIVHAQRVVDEAGPAGAELDTLAAAYAASGDFTQAIAIANRSLARAEHAGETLVAASIRARLELYRAGRPYRADPAAGPRH